MTQLAKLFIPITLFLLSSCGNNPDKEISYEGVYFKYPSYWKVETETSESGNIYIDASEKFASEAIFLISVAQAEVEPQEMLGNFLETLSENFDVEKEPAESKRFGQYETSCIKYKASKLREKAYGEAYAFNMEGKTILVVKQSNRDYDLKHDKYKLMENSLRISLPEDINP
ncbi:hypothetical protein D0T84_22050 [Dysgonomonas sp. 521]|uniref:hypothetical protein n=1 Tax=Dysgonomonas sp. 521 TaxID=2302932 RepID=UPI0013D87002|nr:hypothetical protein [Dysgonomonas sp. 521]NDV97548.1 hypothetical protein [Dysgonomonas sp. 521]